MEIRITKKQNMVVDGVKYKAKAQSSCEGCAFRYGDLAAACTAAPCGPVLRDDGYSVVFIKKKDLK